MRLDRGTYRIPLAVPANLTRVRVTERELTLLLEGIDEALIAGVALENVVANMSSTNARHRMLVRAAGSAAHSSFAESTMTPTGSRAIFVGRSSARRAALRIDV